MIIESSNNFLEFREIFKSSDFLNIKMSFFNQIMTKNLEGNKKQAWDCILLEVFIVAIVVLFVPQNSRVELLDDKQIVPYNT